MKKILLGFGLGLFLFAAVGCDKETVESASIDSREAIQFNAYLGKQATRFAPTTVESLYGGFGVYVFNEGGGLIQPVGGALGEPTLNLYYTGNEWIEGVWTYDEPSLYLPIFDTNDGDNPSEVPSYTYVATWPEQHIADLTASVPFTVEGGDIDFIVAYIASNQSKVDLMFQHALSRINFAVAAPKDVTVTINGIRLGDVYNQGNCSFTSLPAWTAQVGGELYNYTDQVPGGEFTVTSTTSGEPVYLRTHNGTYPGQDVDNSLYLLPQTFDKMVLGYNEDAYIEVTFELTSASYYVEAEAQQLTTEPVTVRAYLKDFQVKEWVSGSSYTYLIDFTRYLTDNKILITPSVNPWEEADVVDGTLSIEMVHLTQSTLDNALEALKEYYEQNAPGFGPENPAQTVLYVDQALKEAVTLSTDKLRVLYRTIYGEENSLMMNEPHPYKFVIYMSNGVADDIGGQAFASLITLSGTCDHWDIAYYSDDMSEVGSPASDMPGTETPFYVIITPKTE